MFIEKLKSGVSKDEFVNMFSFYNLDFQSLYEFLKFQGLPLIIKDEQIYLKTVFTPFYKAKYVILDLEVNNSKPKEGQIIEIGAVKVKDLSIVDEFSFLIYAKEIPKYVTKITGIDKKMLKNQKSQKEILKKFRLFLEDSIIVAHAADFDFMFLKKQFEKENLGDLLNLHLCTISLAKKTLKSNKYGLKSLKETLNLPNEINHRALADARTTTRIFLKSLDNLPSFIKTAQDLVEFAKPNKNKND